VSDLLFPVRCFTCGAVIGDRWEEYEELLRKGEEPKEALDKMGIKRYCCRRMFMTYFDLAGMVMEYSEQGEAQP